jgi:hypothetical protein
LIDTLTTDWGNMVPPRYAGLGWHNAGNNAITARSFKLSAGMVDLQNSVYYDNFAAEAVPEPATLLVVGAGLVAIARRRRSIN